VFFLSAVNDQLLHLSVEMGWWRKKKSAKTDEKQRLVVHENGKVLLEKLIEYCDGKSNPINTLSASQILRATDNFSPNNALFRSR
ncbi:unnamed protein product, partial [Arabidopsis halleri]